MIPPGKGIWNMPLETARALLSRNWLLRSSAYDAFHKQVFAYETYRNGVFMWRAYLVARRLNDAQLIEQCCAFFDECAPALLHADEPKAVAAAIHFSNHRGPGEGNSSCDDQEISTNLFTTFNFLTANGARPNAAYRSLARDFDLSVDAVKKRIARIKQRREAA